MLFYVCIAMTTPDLCPSTTMLKLQEMRPSVESCLAYYCVVGRSSTLENGRTDLGEKSDATTAEEWENSCPPLALFLLAHLSLFRWTRGRRLGVIIALRHSKFLVLDQRNRTRCMIQCLDAFPAVSELFHMGLNLGKSLRTTTKVIMVEYLNWMM